MTTTQISRFAPSVIDPNAVSFVDAWDNDPEDGFRPTVQTRNLYLAQMAPEAKARGGFGACTICGAHLRYVVLMELDATEELFVIGEDCAANLNLAAAIGVKVTDLRAKAAANRENRKTADRRDALLADDPELAAAFNLRDESEFIADVYAKAGDKRGLSDRQVEAVKRPAAKMIAAKARRAAEALLPTVPVLTGRVTVTGEIVGEKFTPGYGYHSADVRKIVVRDDRGFKVYVTCPAAFDAQVSWQEDGTSSLVEAVKVGERVSFVATVTASERDESFGFAKRPTKAVRL